jgi:glycosyltransferase involved in cell wall biosynthesis
VPDPSPVVLHTRVVTGTGGGPEKTILNSPRFLVGHGYRCLCAYLHPPDDPGFRDLRRRAEQASALLLSVPDRGAWDLRVVRLLLEICRRERVTIWHGHDYKTNALGLLLRKLWPMHLVTTVHGWVRHTSRTPLYYWIDRRSLRRYDRVVCVSDDLVQECLAAGVSPEKCLLIENAIDTAEYTRTEAVGEAKRRLGFRGDRLLIGAVGRLSEEKAFDVLIRAVAMLIDGGCDVELAIAGEGDARPALERLIAEQRAPQRFRLLGHRSDVPELLQALDVFALSSLREGLPNVLLEAMALEVPCVATGVAGIPRLIDGRANGLLVAPGAVEPLRDALRRLLESPERRAAFAREGRGTIEQRYSFAVRMEKVRAVYRSLPDPARPPVAEQR